MEENKEPEVKNKEVVQPEQKVDDRPEQNWKAELDRKNAEIARLRAENEANAYARSQQQQKRDPNDIKTWTDQELRVLAKSNDANLAVYKDQAEDLLLERKVAQMRAKERETETRVTADLELRKHYPEANDPTSEFSAKVEQTMREYDLSKTPAGRLVAAKIVAADLKRGNDTADAKGRKNDADRLRDVKSHMVDGDRPKPTESSNTSNLDKKKAELANKLADTRHEEKQVEAIADILKDRGLTRDSFFKR